MAEFVEKRCEDMIPELEQMERIKLFDKNEIREIAKKRKEYEYKIQRHTKCKEDYLRYIQYEMDLLKLVKQRRDKFGITQKKSSIDYAIANKVNHLYEEAIMKFQEDLRFWVAYMKFCKHVRFYNSVSRMIGRMLQIHQDKPKCWYIAARWELEENKNTENAKQFLLRGLHFHPESRLLYTEMFRLELAEAPAEVKTEDDQKDERKQSTDDMPIELKRAYIIYQQASKHVKDVKFVIDLLNIMKEYPDTDKLQNKIVNGLVEDYSHEPLMWDTMARRELEGLVRPCSEESKLGITNTEQTTPRDRISLCNEVYQTAIKKIKTEEMWSLYIECLLEINQDIGSLPNFKRKLLKTALIQAHNAKKLKEKYYVYWIGMLNNDQKDENSQKKLHEVLCWATEAIPDSVSLWHMRLKHYFATDQEDSASAAFTEAIKRLREKSLPIWKMKLLYVQAKDPEKTEEVFKAALQAEPAIAKDFKPKYIEWLVLTKNIQMARKVYKALCMEPPFGLELHKKMENLELMQPEIILKHARKPYEMAILHFGNNNVNVWIDYITFEMKHSDPKNVADLHSRAVKTLDSTLVDTFISKFSLLKTDSDSIGATT
ncbi:U3 small nucleolar RNA-associated protein 6 homolog [Orussus abietinus]|uniref:U3 small nucleolar RNA-associated protein 6 homolog n=1 Tax=Orussus abietinus TaxID=222816 RepID=UPI0006266C64|nr:U3 small nucleolar RNA-associated protein 6 homolog [Orussus abietinus]XP_012284128.1 U3 small nucleolar RNA-associated protein 6 homolog [Orussus abietinus]XP_012284129.1 U3 small nucleolar RNA-associated protein 6 homolog [Orussus abietinus]